MNNTEDADSNIKTLLEYGSILLRWLWLLILVGLISGFAAYYNSSLQPRMYQSSTLMVVNMPSGAVDMDVTTQSMQLTSTYAKTMITKSLLAQAATKLGYPVTGSVRASADMDSPIIAITVIDTDPKRAADTANAVAMVFIEDIDEKQTSRYKELETSIEAEIARIDEEITMINENLANLQAESEKALSSAIGSTSDTENYVRRSQLELSLTQYTQTRYSLVYNLQQIRLSAIKSQTIITQLDPAVENRAPIEPQPLKSGLLGAITGLLAIGGIIFLIVYLQDEIRDFDEITRRWGVPVLGVIAHVKGKEKTIITLDQPRAPITEAYHRLRTNLQFTEVNQPLQTILVTSALPGDGKTTLATNLAVVMSRNKNNVLLIDCDLRRPHVHEMFNIPNRLGLSDIFISPDDQLVDVVKVTSVKGLHTITSGPIPPNPAELLSSNKMIEILSMVKKQYKTVILDSSPILVVADALILASRVDGVILAVNPRETKRANLRDTIGQLSRANANLLGIVLNDVRIKHPHYYYRDKYIKKENPRKLSGKSTTIE